MTLRRFVALALLTTGSGVAAFSQTASVGTPDGLNLRFANGIAAIA